MTFTSIPRTFVRTAVIAGALAVGLTAMPTEAVHAAPVAVTSRTRVADPVADLAVGALAALRALTPSDPTATPASGSAAAAGDYITKRNDVATLLAERLGIDPDRMQEAWSAADLVHQEALLAGLTQLGVPYRRNTSKPGESFDCSGLTTYAWGEAGHVLTRQSSAQIREAEPRTQETAQAGDLAQYPGHVSMWLGVDQAMLHAPYTGKNVEVYISKKRNLKYGDPTTTV